MSNYTVRDEFFTFAETDTLREANQIADDLRDQGGSNKIEVVANSELSLFLIEVFDEKSVLIHCHTYKGWQEDAEENAKATCKFWHGNEWRVFEITAND